MTRFGGGCHIRLDHQSIRNYIEDGILKIQTIHLKDILEESIYFNLIPNEFNFIAGVRISQIQTY